MDRKRFTSMAVLAVMVMLLLASCSMVFEAGISGKVVTEDGTEDRPVANVSVFAYTDKKQRDSDLKRFVAGEITRPSEGAGYVASTTTNNNGEFTVNKIVWETHKSEFGKTDDANTIYLIYYHKDYVPCGSDATVISGSTNASNVYKTLTCSKDYATVRVNVYDVSTGNLMNSACTLEYWVCDSQKSDKLSLTGNASLSVSYAKETASPSITVMLTSVGTNWKMVKANGAAITDSDRVFAIESGTNSIDLYMKSYEITIPAFSGALDSSNFASSPASLDENPANDMDDIPVWLEFKGTDGAFHTFRETKDANSLTHASERTAGNTLKYLHGQFSGIGNSQNYSIRIDSASDYAKIADWDAFDGKTLSVTLRLAFDVAGSTKYSPEFTYTKGSNTALGTIIFDASPAAGAID